VDDRRHRIVRVLEPRHHASPRVGRQLESVAVDVDVVPAFVVPVGDLGRRIPQGAPKSLLHVARRGALRDIPKDRIDARATRDRCAQQSP
jgi:hypothetical protein